MIRKTRTIRKCAALMTLMYLIERGEEVQLVRDIKIVIFLIVAINQVELRLINNMD